MAEGLSEMDSPFVMFGKKGQVWGIKLSYVQTANVLLANIGQNQIRIQECFVGNATRL
jgi:hypothetical protein